MKKAIAVFLLLLLLPISVFGLGQWDKPTFVHGGGLSEEQVRQTAALLGIKEGDEMLTSPVKGEDLANFVGGEPTSTEDMISSALVIKEKTGTGVHVEIKTPENITRVTKEQYAGAAITAGVGDVRILIASPFAVTGESALAGVYKAFELNGEKLSSGAMKLAQEELEVVAGITGESKDKDDFDADKLAQAMVDIKEEIIAVIEKEGQISREEIRRIIEEILEKLHLSSYISTVYIDKIENYFVKFSLTEGLDFTKMKEQLESLSKELAPKIKEILAEAEASGFVDRLLNFFKGFFEKLSTFFD